MNFYMSKLKMLFFFLVYFPSVVLADTIDSSLAHRQAQGVYENIMSPFCPGLTLSACTSGDARELREEIYIWFSNGDSKELVMQKLNSRYGEAIRGVPKVVGFDILAWALPGMFLVIGLFMVYRLKVR